MWRFLQILKIDLPYNPNISPSGVHTKEMKSAYSGDSCIPMFIATLFTIVKKWNQSRHPPIDERMKKMC